MGHAIFQALLDFDDFALRKPMRAMTIAFWVEKEQRPDLREREAESLHALDEPNAFKGGPIVAPDRTVCARGLLQQLKALVIANGFDADPTHLGELADGH